MFNLLCRILNFLGLTTFPGDKYHQKFWQILEKIKRCPNCRSEEYQHGKLRCPLCGTNFCFDCCVQIRTAVDCPHCNKKKNNYV